MSRRLVQYLVESDHRVSPSELERHLARISGEPRRVCRRWIRSLAACGALDYTYEFGGSYLEPSQAQPCPLTGRLFRVPPAVDFIPPPGAAALRLAPGAAFGCGRHPTTRLALRAVDWVCGCGPAIDSVLDVGTGSGVLVIAAVQLGAGCGLGIDIDPCARVEAAENVRINELSGRIRISAETPQTLSRQGSAYALVIANLRTPSLANLRTTLTDLVKKTEGCLVLSGVRDAETAALIRDYGQSGLKPIWTAGEKGWCGVVLAFRR